MKKNILALISIVILYSCAIKKIYYSYNFKTISKGIDFTQQKENWLLNTINLPERSEEKILTEFNKWTKNKTTPISKMIDKQEVRIGNFLTYPFTSESFKFIKETTNYKYLINVYFSENQNSTPKMTIAEITFDVYDITTEEVILSEIVTGSKDNENTIDIGDIHGFQIPVERNMIDGLVKNGLKKLGKNSIY